MMRSGVKLIIRARVDAILWRFCEVFEFGNFSGWLRVLKARFFLSNEVWKVFDWFSFVCYLSNTV